MPSNKTIMEFVWKSLAKSTGDEQIIPSSNRPTSELVDIEPVLPPRSSSRRKVFLGTLLYLELTFVQEHYRGILILRQYF